MINFKYYLLFFVLIYGTNVCLCQNILVVTFCYFNPFHTFILDDITGLIDYGHNVHVFVQSTFLPNCNYSEEDAVSLMPAKYTDYKIEEKCFYFDDPQANKFFQTNKVDIIYAAFGQFAEKAIKLKHKFYPNAKIVVAYQGADMSLLAKKNEKLRNIIFSSVDCFLPVSQEFKRRLISLGCYQNKIKVYYTGIDEKIFHSKSNWDLNDSPTFLSVGRLVEEKGFQYSIRAFAKIAHKHPFAKYLIIGAGYLKEELEQLINDLNMKNKIFLVGPKMHSELCQWFKNSDVFIMPSITGKKGQEEGIPNALKEAMFSKLPCIGTDHTGIPELIKNQETGILVPEKSVDDLVYAMELLLEEKKLREKIAVNGYEFVYNNFRRSKQNEFLHNTFENLIKPINN